MVRRLAAAVPSCTIPMIKHAVSKGTAVEESCDDFFLDLKSQLENNMKALEANKAWRPFSLSRQWEHHEQACKDLIRSRQRYYAEAAPRLLSSACSPPPALLLSSACSPPPALLLSSACSPPPALPRLLSSACSPPPALLNSLSSTRSPPPALLLSSTYSCSPTPALLYLLSSARSPALLYLLPSARSRRQVTFRAVWMVAVKRSIADAAGLESLFTLTVRCGWRVAFGANAACARS